MQTGRVGKASEMSQRGKPFHFPPLPFSSLPVPCQLLRDSGLGPGRRPPPPFMSRSPQASEQLHALKKNEGSSPHNETDLIQE